MEALFTGLMPVRAKKKVYIFLYKNKQLGEFQSVKITRIPQFL